MDIVEEKTLKTKPQEVSKLEQAVSKISMLFRDFFGINNPHHFAFLLLLGILTSLSGYLVDHGSQILIDYKRKYCTDITINWWVRYFIWTVCAVSFTVIACALVTYWSREAEGSGICEMKAIMSGLNIYRFFSLKTFTVKVLGLIAALTAGLSVGKEGPFVHMSACIANKLAKLRWFSDIDRNQSFKKQMLAAAVAAGMTSFFKAPMGGVLFSIEVASTYYMVSNLFKAFFCATCCIVMVELLQTIGFVQLFDKTQFPAVDTDHEVFLFALLGVLAGCFGALFVNAYYQLIVIRDTVRAKFLTNRFQWSVCVGLTIGLVCFPISFLMLPDKTVVNHMFSSNDSLLQQSTFNIWGKPAFAFNMIIFCILKFFLIILAISAPIPAGVFTPCFTLGAVFGRLYGYALKNIGLALGYNLIKNEGIYAIIGAAAVTGSVTRTTSVAMIVFELTGQTSLMIPILVGVLTSYAVSNSLSVSVYDVMIEIKNYPFLPSLVGVSTKNFQAKDFMNQNFLFLTKDAKLADIAIIINKIGFQPVTIPVVESNQKKTLLFSVQSQSLRKYLIKYFEKISHKLDQETKQYLNQYFYALSQLQINPKKLTKDALIDPLVHQQYPELITNDNELGKLSTNKNQNKQKLIESLEAFWMNQVDFQDYNIQIDKAPFIVMEDTAMSKLHFIFIMLNISQVNVVKKGKISGIITKTEFMNQKSQQQQSNNVSLQPLRQE